VLGFQVDSVCFHGREASAHFGGKVERRKNKKKKRQREREKKRKKN